MPLLPRDYIPGEQQRYKQSQNIGMSTNYFAQMKIKSPELYKYIYNKPGNSLKERYEMFENERESLVSYLQMVWYRLEKKRLIFAFSKYLKQQGLFNQNNSFSTSGKKTLFKTRPLSTYSGFIKYKEIALLAKKFIKELEDKNEL